MKPKSIVLTAVAAVGMVAVADVWDIKFTFKTVNSATNKKVSYTIKGAWDDSGDGSKYSFWDNKTKVPLKNVVFGTGNKVNYGRSNVALNAQLFWGTDVENPEGLFVSAGMGTDKSKSGNFAGTYNGKPASGTMSIKRSSKSFDALNKGGAVDVDANKAASNAVKTYQAGCKDAADVIASADENARKISDLNEQLAASEKAKADAVAAAEKDVADAKAKVADAEKAVDAAKAEAAEATKAVADAKAANEALEKAKDELQKANDELAATVEVYGKAIEQLNDASSNTGLITSVKQSYKQDVDGYLMTSLWKAWDQAQLDGYGWMDKNVTNSIVALTNKYAELTKKLDDAITIQNDMLYFYNKTFEYISESNELANADGTAYYGDGLDPVRTGKYNADQYAGAPFDGLYGLYEVVTNGDERAKLIDDPADPMVAATNTAYKALYDDLPVGAYTVLTNQEQDIKDQRKIADDLYDEWVAAGKGSDWGKLADYRAAETAYTVLTNDYETMKKDEAEKRAAYDDAKKTIDDFVAKEDIKNLKKEIEDTEAALKSKLDKWGSYTIKEFQEKVQPAQDKVVDDLINEIADLNTTIGAAEAAMAPTLIHPTSPTDDPPYSQDDWTVYYDGLVTFYKEEVADDQLMLDKLESNIKAEKDLATLMSVELNDKDLVDYLQEKYTAGGYLTDDDDAPIVIEAAAKWGITLTKVNP